MEFETHKIESRHFEDVENHPTQLEGFGASALPILWRARCLAWVLGLQRSGCESCLHRVWMRYRTVFEQRSFTEFIHQTAKHH